MTDKIPMPRLEKLSRELFACSRCGFCRVWNWKGVNWVCPTYPYTEAFDTQYARGRVNMAQAILRGDAEISEEFLVHLSECTLCASCAEHCPVDLPLTEIWHALRADLADAGYALPAHLQAAENIRVHHNVFGKPHRASSAPVEKRHARVLYFPGCQTSRKARQIGKATCELLTKLHVDFAMLEEDACCGYPLYEVGQLSVMKEDAAYTLAKIREYDPEIILTTCIGCYRSLSTVYPKELGVDLSCEVKHAHEFFADLLPDQMERISRKVTFHDPCIMGRYMGVYDAPRELIQRVPGIELVEMYSNHQHALCCGAGGGVLNACTDLAGEVSVERLQQAIAAGAEEIVTSCPTCVVNLKRSASKAGSAVAVVDLVELLNEAIRAD